MAKDWSKLYRRYKGLWVALQDNESTVIASGKTAKSTLDKAREKGFNNPILFRVPSKIMPLLGETEV